MAFTKQYMYSTFHCWIWIQCVPGRKTLSYITQILGYLLVRSAVRHSYQDSSEHTASLFGSLTKKWAWWWSDEHSGPGFYLVTGTVCGRHWLADSLSPPGTWPEATPAFRASLLFLTPTGLGPFRASFRLRGSETGIRMPWAAVSPLHRKLCGRGRNLCVILWFYELWVKP